MMWYCSSWLAMRYVHGFVSNKELRKHCRVDFHLHAGYSAVHISNNGLNNLDMILDIKHK